MGGSREQRSLSIPLNPTTLSFQPKFHLSPQPSGLGACIVNSMGQQIIVHNLIFVNKVLLEHSKPTHFHTVMAAFLR